jgi:predicted tellurium resistance membrane protein TerC
MMKNRMMIYGAALALTCSLAATAKAQSLCMINDWHSAMVALMFLGTGMSWLWHWKREAGRMRVRQG